MSGSWQNQPGSNAAKPEYDRGMHNYDTLSARQGDEHGDASRWNPRHWGKKAWSITGLAIAVIVAIVVAVVVVEAKKNRYPNYTQLSYSKVETISGTTFFDSFDYFTGYDPTSGFVHYLLAPQQTQYNLTFASASSAIVKVDNTQNNQSTGRYSVRLTSKNPSTWPEALADFPGTDCDIPSHFNNQSIIIDIDLCGSFAGAPSIYNTQDSCPGTCEDYVANNPQAFDDAFWEFGDFDVYQANGA